MNNYSTDGFNERSNFIHNSNDKKRLSNMNSNYDNSLVGMRIKENMPDVKTSSSDNVTINNYDKMDKTILNNAKMNNLNKPNLDNPVSRALNNRFNNFK